MKRWALFVFANVVAIGALVALSESFDEPPWWLLAAVVSLGFPMSLLLFVIRPDPILLALVLPLNPFLWAGCVEWTLRRYVDRPRDSDAA